MPLGHVLHDTRVTSGRKCFSTIARARGKICEAEIESGSLGGEIVNNSGPRRLRFAYADRVQRGEISHIFLRARCGKGTH